MFLRSPSFVRSTSCRTIEKKLAFFQHFRFPDCKSWSLKLFSIPQHKASHVYDVKRELFGRKHDFDGFYICIENAKDFRFNLRNESTINSEVQYFEKNLMFLAS